MKKKSLKQFIDQNMNKPTKECACLPHHYNSTCVCSCSCHFVEPLEEKGSKTEKGFMDMMEKDLGVKFVDVTPLEEKKPTPGWKEELGKDLFLKQWSAKKGANKELIEHIEFIIQSEIDKARREERESLKKEVNKVIKTWIISTDSVDDLTNNINKTF